MNLLSVLLQAMPEVSDTLANSTELAAQEQQISLLDMALKGGCLMIPLALMLLIAIYIFIERLVVLKKASKEDSSFMNRVKDYIYDGKIDSALSLCRDTKTPSARMIEKGISRLGRPMSDVLVAIENVGNIEIAKLEKGFTTMATIAGGAPMVGFLGTVIGMIEAFFNMSSKGDNTINLSELSGGIYTAMVTTVAGLIVGVCAYFAYNYLVARLDQIMRKLETKNMEFLDLLNEPAAGKR
ncbi:MAG: MotA/TolQ/ExbB proton channel family protein [Paludibacteraceae bacterium]|nr:MotA/TolQ/ExbB proton channel family protein [Paludibacteraceae bacterium]